MLDHFSIFTKNCSITSYGIGYELKFLVDFLSARTYTWMCVYTHICVYNCNKYLFIQWIRIITFNHFIGSKHLLS